MLQQRTGSREGALLWCVDENCFVRTIKELVFQPLLTMSKLVCFFSRRVRVVEDRYCQKRPIGLLVPVVLFHRLGERELLNASLSFVHFAGWILRVFGRALGCAHCQVKMGANISSTTK